MMMARLCPDAVRVSMFRLCLLPTFLLYLVCFTDETFNLVTYDHQTLLEIRDQFGLFYVSPSFDSKSAFPAEIFRQTDCYNRSSDKPRKRSKHRGRRRGIRNRLRSKANHPPLSSILLANVQRDVRDCSILCFTESWLSPSIPDHSVTLAEHFSIARMDRTESRKTKGGGVCFKTNNKWCDPRNITI